MFPVTLQMDDDSVATVWPPCYGFLQWQNYSGGDYDPDYEDSSLDYESNSGWNIKASLYHSNPPSISGRIEENILQDNWPMDGIKIIWNSGTHLPVIGTHRDRPDELYQYMCMDSSLGDPRPKSNVALWAEEKESPDVTERSVMEALEAFMDVGRESCLVWHDDGFMGVKTDNVNADRCLFYLMVNRHFYEPEEQLAVFSFLDNLYVKGYSILQALALSRIFSNTINVFEEKKPAWSGHDYDSCILPASLFTVGIGSEMAEPRTTPWRQESYREGDGHLRDDDYSYIQYEDDSELSVNNSMFLPVLHPDLTRRESTHLNKKCLIHAFIQEISKTEATENKICNGRWNSRPSTHNMIQALLNGNLPENESFDVVELEQWGQIIEDLFFNK